jgi:hypothetical protein
MSLCHNSDLSLRVHDSERGNLVFVLDHRVRIAMTGSGLNYELRPLNNRTSIKDKNSIDKGIINGIISLNNLEVFYARSQNSNITR